MDPRISIQPVPELSPTVASSSTLWLFLLQCLLDHSLYCEQLSIKTDHTWYTNQKAFLTPRPCAMRAESSVSTFTTPPSAKTTCPHHWNPQDCWAGSHSQSPLHLIYVRQHWTGWVAHLELCFTQLLGYSYPFYLPPYCAPSSHFLLLKLKTRKGNRPSLSSSLYPPLVPREQR